MKIRDLIHRLSQFDQDEDVCILTSKGYERNIVEINKIRAGQVAIEAERKD